MADLRLLTLALAAMVSLLVGAWCAGSRKVEAPRLAGQIVDKHTSEPIEGMAVYQGYSTMNRSILTSHTVGERDHRWTMTDAEGRFEFPAHVVAEALKDYVDIDPTPFIVLVHRDYGRPFVHVPEDRSQWESIVWEIEPDLRSLEAMRSTGSRCDLPCRDLAGASYEHCYELACNEPLPESRKAPERTR